VLESAGEEGRGRIWRGGDLTGLTRIDEALEIRAAAGALDRVGRGGIAVVVARGRERREFAARGEANDADRGRIDVPFAGARAHDPERALRIGQGIAFDGVRLRRSGRRRV